MAASSGPSIVHQGYLYKLPISFGSRIRRGWKSRYFVLNGDQLSYYTKQTAKTAKGSMNVHSCKIIDAVDLTEKEFSFAIVFGNPSSPNHYLFLRAASLSQKSKWVSALSSAASFEVPFSGWFPARSAPSKPAPLPVQANPVLGRFQVPFVQYLPVGVDAPREVTLEDGSVYRGSWLKGLAHGHGALQLASGRSYHGQWKEGMACGQGKFESPSSTESYKGHFSFGQPDGIGRLEQDDGSIYEGDFNAGKKSGSGTITLKNGDSYSGAFDNDQMSGKGALRYSNGDKYEGEMANNCRSGRGKFTRPKLFTFLGQFAMDQPIEGVITYVDGGKYRGSVDIYIQRSGEGEMRWANGDVYDGYWIDDLEDGEGKMEYGNGDIYRGEWRAGKRSGRGQLRYYASGDVYYGLFHHQVANGEGIIEYKDGSKFQGTFINGVKSGKGSLQLTDGRILEGMWTNGELTSIEGMTHPNGDRYIGYLQDNAYHGDGELHFGNGSIFKAKFDLGNFPDNGLMVYANGDEWTGRVDENGRRQGYGIMSWVNGDQFSGTYLDDKRHGRGNMITSDGNDSIQYYDMDEVKTMVPEVDDLIKPSICGKPTTDGRKPASLNHQNRPQNRQVYEQERSSRPQINVMIKRDSNASQPTPDKVASRLKGFVSTGLELKNPAKALSGRTSSIESVNISFEDDDKATVKEISRQYSIDSVVISESGSETDDPLADIDQPRCVTPKHMILSYEPRPLTHAWRIGAHSDGYGVGMALLNTRQWQTSILDSRRQRHQSGNEYGRRLDILQNVVKNQQEQKSTLKANPHSDASQTRRIDITTRLRARQSDTPVSNIIVGRLTKTTTAGQDETVKMGQNTESAKELNENKVKKYINLGNTDIVEDGDSQELKGDMMERWTVNDVSMWLKTQGMGEFIDDFVSAEIDGSKIHSLVSENSLEKVIEQTGHSIVMRSQIIFAVKNLAAANLKSAPLRGSVKKLQIRIRGANNVGHNIDETKGTNEEWQRIRFRTNISSARASPIGVGRLREIWEAKQRRK